MTYFEKIRELTKEIPTELVDFSQPRDLARTPTQASSNFITNKEQGDWAENLVFRAINETSKNFVAVKYGKSDNLVAGEDGFDSFYQEFQNEFRNNCDGADWFWLNFKGYLLTVFTLGIYGFWWQRDIFNYYIDNMSMRKDEQKIQCYSTATGGGFFKLLIGNLFIIIFTLGFGTAWAEMRTQRFIWNNIKMKGDINLDEIHQTEEEYTDAFGEDAMDFFEIDLA